MPLLGIVRLVSTILALWSLAASAWAQSLPVTGTSVESGIGTLGFTVGGGVRLSDRFGLRGVIGTGSFGYEDTAEGETYEGDVEAFGLGVMADYYPFGTGLRLTGGAFLPDYEARLTGRDITIGPLTSDIEVDITDRSSIALALAIGFAGRLGQRFTLSGDLGAMYVGGFDIEARDPNGTFSQGDIDAEIRDIRDALEDANIVPYASFSIGMSF